MGGMDSETLIVDAAAEPQRPRPTIGVKDVLCVGPIILNSIYYYAGIPLTPLLLGRNPLLLSALRGTIASMVTAGAFARVGKVPLAARADRADPDLDDDRPFLLLGREALRTRPHQLPQRDRSALAAACRARRALLPEIRCVDGGAGADPSRALTALLHGCRRGRDAVSSLHPRGPHRHAHLHRADRRRWAG